ncbi:hypothetical protein GCM10022198_08560 [Klugiella xanthotipulae]|uniref:Uncharacterized protein n=1 Tax=Klugiella xanthotipulae TaxID=244735 RepID=A0A543I432_9MICO|nr:hypothetical protein [Klugiella xanthotipulae]TQM65230.1 hypothetical protein FB466_0020 [Klugiella xanthotipulae]
MENLIDDDTTESLHGELALLRKNEGFIPRRLARTPVVDEVLRGALTDSYERLQHRFISAIHTLDVDEATLLLDIFALSSETQGVPTLKQRREIHGRRINRSIETVAAREDAALNHLHTRLVQGQYAQSPLVLHVPEMHGGIIYEHVAVRVRVVNRQWAGTWERYRFVNMVDELDFVTISRSYPALVTTPPGGDFKVNTRNVTGGTNWNDHFWHLNAAHTATEPMLREGAYDLRFAMAPDPDDSTSTQSITRACRALHERALLFSLQVKFDGEIPRSFWRYERVSQFAIPSSADEYNTCSLDAHQALTFRMRDVYGGLFSGFGWEWGEG